MTMFNLYVPIQVRYGDIDAQGHANNVRIISYLEEARIGYLRTLDLWDGKSFQDLGLIVADVHASYLAPIHLDQKIRVGIRVVRLGNKSMHLEYQIENAETGQVAARCESVMVTYDYHTEKSIPIPPDWREKIQKFEGLAA